MTHSTSLWRDRKGSEESMEGGCWSLMFLCLMVAWDFAIRCVYVCVIRAFYNKLEITR